MFCRAFLGISALLNDTAGPELVFLCRAMNFHSTFFPAPGFSLFNRGQSSTSMLIHGRGQQRTNTNYPAHSAAESKPTRKADEEI
jgi:hypothetical protein